MYSTDQNIFPNKLTMNERIADYNIIDADTWECLSN